MIERFNTKHKIVKVELKPFAGTTPYLKFFCKEDEDVFTHDIYVSRSVNKYVEYSCLDWETIITYKDSENLEKLKIMGIEEEMAIRILDKLGLE